MSNPAYEHQKKVRRLLKSGKNVILQAPTGAGKTRAAIEPFLHSRNLARYGDGGFLPSKMIYSVPMRVLARQFHTEYEKTIKTFNKTRQLELHEAIQTGDMPEDRELTKDLIFATIDQTLSSFLMSPYGLSKGRANLNLGAVLSSYLVFDEFHLYSPDSTLPTVLQMLRLLNGITPFVLMTATFSDALIHRLAAQLNAEVVGLSDEDRASFANLDSQKKTRHYHASEHALTPQRVLDLHKKRSIVICNTVQRARTMAQQLRTQTEQTDTEVILLHSRFLKADRDRIEDNIRLRFGKIDKSDGSLIVVATQAIEVGVDITSTVMHTELAPANAIIQRAGRCARYPGNTGDVYIYRYVLDSDGERVDLTENPLPYGGRYEKQQMGATFVAFTAVNGQRLAFEREQAIIDAVHSEADEAIINDLDADSAGHRQKMFMAMNGNHEHVGDLVRKVIAQPVTIHDDPASIKKPYQMPVFNLHPGTMKGCVQDWLERYHAMDDAPDWCVKYLKYDENADDSQASSIMETHKWIPENNLYPENFTVPYGALVVVHPHFAAYDPEEGFMPETGGGWHDAPDLSDDEKEVWNGYPYKLETYAEHIRLVNIAAFESKPAIDHTAYWDELAWAAHKLAARLNLTYEQLYQAAQLTILLHDVGKLSKGWQGWVRRYQAEIEKPVERTEAYAHTDYDPKNENHKIADRKAGKRPPHAVEGALATDEIVFNHVNNPIVATAIYSAIARHHSPSSSSNMAYHLIKDAREVVFQTLSEPLQDLSLDFMMNGNKDVDIRKEYIIQLNSAPHLEEINCFFLYAILVRLLRKSDNKGTEWGSKHVSV